MKIIRALVAVALVVAVLLPRAGLPQQANKSNGEAIAWPSMICRGARGCEPLNANGWLFAKPGQAAVVIISHGSSGIDYRVFDRVDALQKEGYAAFVIDHWGSRGISEIMTNLNAGPSKGASELNMAFDIQSAAQLLRSRGFTKVGGLGASYGGGAQIMVQQKWASEIIVKAMEFHYKQSFKFQPLDAQVSLYGFCGLRNKVRDKYNGTPILFMSGEKDQIDPADFCVRYAPWMNERGGNAKTIVMPGMYHTFDAREPASFIRGIRHTGACDLYADETGIKNEKNGDFIPGTDINVILAKMIEKCTDLGTPGFWSGNDGRDPQKTVVPLWMNFVKTMMPAN